MFLSVHTQIIMLGSDYLETLLRHVDAANLPDFLGGTCTCAYKGGCLAQPWAGPWNEIESHARKSG